MLQLLKSESQNKSVEGSADVKTVMRRYDPAESWPCSGNRQNSLKKLRFRLLVQTVRAW